MGTLGRVTLTLGLCLVGIAQAKPALYTYNLRPAADADCTDPAQARKLWDTFHLVSALQGIVNRDAPRLYVFAVPGGPNGNLDRYWLDTFSAEGQWLTGREQKPLDDLSALLSAFRDDIRGLVVYDESVPATSNVASTVAGVEDLLPVRWDVSEGSLYRWLTDDPAGPKLPVKVWLVQPDGSPRFTGTGTLPDSATPSTGSAKCDAYLWAKEKYLDTGRCNAALMGYYLDAYWITHPKCGPINHCLMNHDYLVSRRGFVWDLAPIDDEVPVDDPTQPVGTDVRTLKAILQAAYDQLEGKQMVQVCGFVPWDTKYTSVAGSKHEPVPVEWRCVELLSSYNAYIDADALSFNAMANASVFQHYPLKKRYPQPRPTEEDLEKKGYLLADGTVAPKHYVTIYAGDYDSAAWLYHKLPELWSDPARGEIPIGWAFNPTLANRFAPGMAYAREKKTSSDYFVAGDSGAGYVNPGCLQEPRPLSGLPSAVDLWARHCQRYYAQWDLSITGFIIDGYAPKMDDATLAAYTTFSPDGIVAQKIEPVGVFEGMPFVRMNVDLPDDLDAAVEAVLGHLGEKTPDFKIFRTILWNPGKLKELYQRVEASDSDVVVLDPFSFFMLVKKHVAQ